MIRGIAINSSTAQRTSRRDVPDTEPKADTDGPVVADRRASEAPASEVGSAKPSLADCTDVRAASAALGLWAVRSRVPSICLPLSGDAQQQRDAFAERYTRIRISLPQVAGLDQLVKHEDGQLKIYTTWPIGVSLLNMAAIGQEARSDRFLIDNTNPGYVDAVKGQCEAHAAHWDRRVAGLKAPTADELNFAGAMADLKNCGYAKWINQLFTQQSTLYIAERHSDAAAIGFLIDNMAHLASNGFVLFTEHVEMEQQPLLDAYLNDKNPRATIDPLLATLANRKSNGQTHALFKAAKEHGVRVIGIDSAAARWDGATGDNMEALKLRRGMNWVAAAVIEEAGTDKCAVHLGLAHVKTAHVGDAGAEAAPGLAAVIQGPTLYLHGGRGDGASTRAADLKYEVARNGMSTANEPSRQAPPILDLSDEYDLRIKLVQGSWRAAVEVLVDEYSDDDADAGSGATSTDEDDYFSDAAKLQRKRALDALDAPPDDKG